jgi:F0F1-type ATP synthase assembly protein I
MERQQLIQIGITLVIGILIGIGIGFALWHGAGASGTCAVPGVG